MSSFATSVPPQWINVRGSDSQGHDERWNENLSGERANARAYTRAHARTIHRSISISRRVSRGLSPYFQRSHTDLKRSLFSFLLSLPTGVFLAARRNLARNYPALWFPPEKRHNNKPRYVDRPHAMRATRISDVRLIILANANVKDALCTLYEDNQRIVRYARDTGRNPFRIRRPNAHPNIANDSTMQAERTRLQTETAIVNAWLSIVPEATRIRSEDRMETRRRYERARWMQQDN
jgi:hypothetical protein